MILIGSDIGEISEDGADDVDGMDASAAHIANLLSSEPPDGTFAKDQHIKSGSIL